MTLLATAAMVLFWPGFTTPFPRPEERFGLAPFVANLLLVQNWAFFLPPSWNSPSWSLSAEWAAYLVFPAFLVAAGRARRPMALAMAC